jgi:hypothetical protein
MKLFNVLSLCISLFILAIADYSVASILMVYPDGSGEYLNIQMAMDAANIGDTVMLSDGTYHGRGNINLRYNGKAITVCSQSGNPASVIIDVEGTFDNIAERGFIFDQNEASLSILRDLTVIHGSADAPCPECEGGGIYIRYSSPTVIDVICHDNYAANGAAIMCDGGSATIKNCTLINNAAIEGAGLMCLDSTQATVSNCLFSRNHADLKGGGISLSYLCNLILKNCTISNNDAPDGSGLAAWTSNYNITNSIVSFNGQGPSGCGYEGSSFSITYSDIFGNIGGNWIDSLYGPSGLNGNIEQDPLFADTIAGNFHLTQNSPCVDSGDPASLLDPDNSRADMGTFYFNHLDNISDAANLIPSKFEISQNYPNPFNTRTTINYALSIPSHVTIDIFDLLGRKIETVLNEEQQAGYHQIIWDAANQTSGLYFYRLSTGAISLTKKMLLVK